MYTLDVTLTLSEQEIVFRIRQLISDTKEVFVDDVDTSSACSSITASGSLYQLSEPRGYPQEVYINNVEVVSGITVLGYKYLRFSTPVLSSGVQLTVIYDHFNHSDLEIIDTYDSSAFTYLTAQCNLTLEDLGPDLLILATAYILLSKDLVTYIKSAVDLQDSDSKFDASRRPQFLNDMLNRISKELKDSLEAKTNCKFQSLPVYKVE